MNQIYKRDNFVIVPFYKTRKKIEFMIINNSKKRKQGFEKAHTHLRSFEMAKYLINLSINNKINSSLSPYLLKSLIRISEDEKYISDLENLISVKRQKGKKMGYRNNA